MKHLKSLLAVLLTLTMFMAVCAAPACAAPEEGLPYMEQLSQSTYINTMFLTTDSYPEICIGPSYFGSAYISQYSEPYFVHFPCPQDTYAAEFDESSCSFIDMSYGRQYFYVVQGSAAYETFINEAEADEYILADGSDGIAIYLEPAKCRANALIGATDIDKNTKVQIRIYDDSLENLSEQQIIDSLSEQITAEAARVKSSMRVDLMEKYWTDGRFTGFKQICSEQNSGALIMTYTLPEGYLIQEMSSGAYTIVKLGGEDTALTVDLDLETHSYVDYMLEEEPDSVTTVDIDGVEYRIYTNWNDDHDKIYSATADRAVAENAGYSGDETLYLVLSMDPDGDFTWTSEDAVVEDLKDVVAGVQLDFGQAIPDYRSAEPYPAAAAPETGSGAVPTDSGEAPAQAAGDAWTCSSCGAENSGGNFCSNCGAAREQGPLVCSKCGYQVPEGENPKFCANCGNPF